jgi:hypothetical protein
MVALAASARSRPSYVSRQTRPPPPCAKLCKSAFKSAFGRVNVNPAKKQPTTRQELKASAREEAEALHEELAAAHDALAAMDRQVAVLEGFRWGARPGRVLGRR